MALFDPAGLGAPAPVGVVRPQVWGDGSMVSPTVVQSFFREHQDWLVHRALDVAREQGYTAYTTTLLEAWRRAVGGLVASLEVFAPLPPAQWEIPAGMDFSASPVTAFGVEEARRHRERGVTLGMFLGLMKYLRRTFLDLVSERWIPAGERGEVHDMLMRFFDQMEVGFCSEWARATTADHLAELQTANRVLTSEKHKYLTVFESISEPVFLFDSHNLLENCNLAAARLFLGHEIPGALYYGGSDWARERIGPELMEALISLKEAQQAVDITLPTTAGQIQFVAKTREMADI
ncbi:MAG: hypothetical protein H7831_18920, partial [Magnetococcus sp. WYHC-3]